MCIHCSPHDRRDDDELRPTAEALLAATLALMTGVAEAAPGAACVRPMSLKVLANLDELARHPGLSRSMRQLAAHLGLHWQQLVQTARGEARAAGERARWVPASTVVQ